MGPVGLRDGLPGAAGDGPGVVQGAVGADVGEDQFGAVPRHAGMVPGEPGRVSPVGREPRPGHEPVPVVGEFAYGAPVLGGGAVQRYGGQDTAHVGGPVTGELLQHAPHLAPLRPEQRLRPAQAGAHRGHGRERTRLAARVAAVEALVGEVHEDQQRPVLAGQGGPRVSAVLDDAAAHVPRRGQHRLLPAVGVPPHQGAPAALAGARLGPPHLVADEAHVLRVPVVRGGQGRVDRRGPGPVRQRPHRLPHSFRRSAGTGRAPGPRSAAPRRGPARRPRGTGRRSRSPPAASAV